MQDMASKGRVVAYGGERHWTHQQPERMVTRGDQNGMRLHPESVLRGEKAAAAKLTEEQVEEIRDLEGTMSMAKIGAHMGVSATQVWRIIRRKSWEHV